MKRFFPVLALVLSAGTAQSDCAPHRVTVIGDWGRAAFNVAIADDPDERARGLMFVEEMPTMAGMLFIYEAPQITSFWMMNTLIPLDMLFADAAGRIVTVHENAVPQDLTSIRGGDNIQFVLEINGGMSRRLGIVPGDALQHPAIGPDAVAPCPAG